ncbi:MAG TPA: hypothetical protein VIC61_06405 [Gammaproteobacteria bacterium]
MQTYLRITALIFGVVALVHALRLIVPWPVVIAGWSAPQWVSVVGVIVAGALCAWAISLLIRSRTH